MRSLLLLTALLSLGACRMANNAAQKDPMRCERDPKCQAKQGRTADCSLQCSDDPACVERCESIQQSTNTRLGH